MNYLKRYLLITLVFIFITICNIVFAQEEELLPEPQVIYIHEEIFIQEEIYIQKLNGQEIYVINSFEFFIDGITKSYALNYITNFRTGEEIKGMANLEKFIRDKTQLIHNERVIESIRIEYAIAEAGEDGKYPVDLKIYVKDTWNIIALPYPKYDSNSGLSLTIKARDYNFLGTMNPLRIDVGYQRDIQGRNFYNFMLDSNFLFYFFGLNWNVDFDHDYTFRPDLELAHYYKNVTGISAELPFKRTVFTFGFAESIFLNHEYETKKFHKGLYLSSRPYISWRIPVGINYYDFGELIYTPSLSATINHEFPRWSLPEELKGPFINFSHLIGFSRVDWHGNFRKGASAYVSNSISMDFFKLKNNNNPWGASLTINGRGYTMFNSFSGLTAQITYRHHFFDNYDSSSGDYVRGIIDSKINADSMLSFNFDFPVRVLQVRPSTWSERNRFLRIFDLDLIISPIIDLALYNDPVRNIPFSFENLLIGGGLEVIVYPERWRSLFLRISFAMGLQTGNLGDGFSREIFIGMDLFY